MSRHALGAQPSHSRCTTPATLESGARAQGLRVDGRSGGGAERFGWGAESFGGGAERSGGDAQKVTR